MEASCMCAIPAMQADTNYATETKTGSSALFSGLKRFVTVRFFANVKYPV